MFVSTRTTLLRSRNVRFPMGSILWFYSRHGLFDIVQVISRTRAWNGQRDLVSVVSKTLPVETLQLNQLNHWFEATWPARETTRREARQMTKPLIYLPAMMEAELEPIAGGFLNFFVEFLAGVTLVLIVGLFVLAILDFLQII